MPTGFFKAVDVMKAVAELLESVEGLIPPYLPGVMIDFLVSTAELTREIANDLNSEQDGNVRHCECCDRGGTS
jgi:hypothetical protein